MMSALLPLLLFEEEANRRREQNFRQFVSTIPPSSSLTQPAKGDSPTALDKALLHLLESGRFSDMQFLVGANAFCFDCHKAIVGGRSEVLAIAMEHRWAEYNVVANKSVVRLPEADVDAFRVFLKYLYSDKLNLELNDGNIIDQIDLLLKVTSLAHMYQVDGLLKDCTTQLTAKINVRTCWSIYKELRLIAPSLSEKSFKFLCDNIHEAAAGNEYLKWDAETVRRILSLHQSFVSELNLFVALLNWQKLPVSPSEPPRKEIFEQSLLPLIRFPSMNLVSFAKAMKTKVLSDSEARRLRRYITNPNPGRRNTTIYSDMSRFVDIHPFVISMNTKSCRTTTCSDDGWNSSDDNFMELIDSQRAEFSIEINSPTTILGLMLHSPRKYNTSVECRFNMKITFFIYIGQSVMHEEERPVIIGGPSSTGSLVLFVLKQPFQMHTGRSYQFHVLYTLLEDDEDMVDEDETYEYNVTWNMLPPYTVITRKIGHGIILKINYRVEADDGDDRDHDRTPRWIQSVDFKSKVSQNCQQFCAVS